MPFDPRNVTLRSGKLGSPGPVCYQYFHHDDPLSPGYFASVIGKTLEVGDGTIVDLSHPDVVIALGNKYYKLCPNGSLVRCIYKPHAA